MSDTAIFLGKGSTSQSLSLKFANRHGLICGATGTGKTVTLQILAEGFSKAGVPVFAADVKGDLSGIAMPGIIKETLNDRAVKIGLETYRPEAFPVAFWDLFGKRGHPIRATISEMGPILLSRLLDLNETQEGVLTLAFRVADDERLLVLDLKDLRALLVNLAERSDELTVRYGNVAKTTIGSIQRRLLVLEEQGASEFFGEPALDLNDFIRLDENGMGVVNILAADKLMQTPKLYATFLLWLLSELFEELPEIGDTEKPILVFFFDEAHLLFEDAPKALVEIIEQVVRLIRSKGVGIYFVTQNPQDVPDSVSSQLGARIQHALRAFTPKEQKAIKTAAELFRPNPSFSTKETIMQLGVGEALVSTLEAKGAPSIVERTLIRPPSSRMGAITEEERHEVMQRSDLGEKYDEPIDRESAFEILSERASRKSQNEQSGTRNTQRPEKRSSTRTPTKRRSNRQSAGEAALKTAVRTFSSMVTREIVRGMLGGMKRRR